MATTLALGNNNSLPDVETTFITEEVLKTSDSITSNTPPPYLPNFQDFHMNSQITENYVKPVEFLPGLPLLVQNLSSLSICDCCIEYNDVKEYFNQSPNSTPDFQEQNRENFKTSEVPRRGEVNSTADLENQVSNLTCGDLREISTPIAHEVPSHALSEVATIDNCKTIPFPDEEASLNTLLFDK